MPFSDNAFTNTWLENTYSDPIFADIDFDNFDAAIRLSDPSVNQWGASYLPQPQPSLDTYPSPTSECEEFFTSPVIPTIESMPQTILYDNGLAAQNPLKRRSSSIESDDTPFVDQQPKPKRGRPSTGTRPRLRLSRATASSASSTTSGKSTSASNKPNTASRTPHNQVERKYRESLNTEMERLRLAVPATARWEEGVYCQAGKLKPSKAMVLASAISYIASLEREMGHLRRENLRLIGEEE
ncbi:hypothetical protein EG328_005118 [Venturia inaequalis]|uniref:BHLH domain-containing protein n=1 Tax=Venturia inaequalis TaxID=5025 RepID=A0A8H3UMR5_VENIN|nr:hypothetical protein EG328_005118 [Venturia inaequalis]